MGNLAHWLHIRHPKIWKSFLRVYNIYILTAIINNLRSVDFCLKIWFWTHWYQIFDSPQSINNNKSFQESCASEKIYCISSASLRTSTTIIIPSDQKDILQCCSIENQQSPFYVVNRVALTGKTLNQKSWLSSKLTICVFMT